jgi:hypothetical protein
VAERLRPAASDTATVLSGLSATAATRLADRVAHLFALAGIDALLAAYQIAAHLSADPDDVERCLRADRRFGECGVVRVGRSISTGWRLRQPMAEPPRFQRSTIKPIT